MNKDSKEYRRVKGEIDNKLVEIVSWNWHDDPDQCLTDAIDEILSIEGLAILADDQSLPRNRYVDYHEHRGVYSEAQRDMERASFRKVI